MMGGEDSCRILVASMSKKRGRSTAAKVDEGPDVSFAEGLLFQLASDTDDPQKPPAKRGKSSSAKLPTSADDNSSHNNGAITDLKGEDDNDSAAAAEDGSTSAALTGPTNGKHPAAIRPSSALRHCDGFDVVRKGSRGRGRQLMVLPGALGLGSGGAGGTAAVKLGTLSTATPGCPVLYVEFPEGRLKCMGRTVHTKGRFFTLYADKVAKRATRMDCRDVFDSVVFFGKACWLGKKEDNPEDEPLPLPESLHFLPEEASGGGEAALRTHFGGGNPGSLLTASAGSSSSNKPENGVGGTDPEQAGDAGDNEEHGEPGEAAAAAAPARRSSRATKSTVTYVEDSNDSENGDDDSGSSSSGSDNDDDEDGDGDGGVSQGGPKFAAVVKEKDGGAKEGVEVFSILDAPTAERKPVTIGSGKVESAKKATPAKKAGRGGKNGPMSGGKGKGKGKGRRAVASASSSEGDGASDEEGGSSDEEDSAGGKAAEPSRRSSRASAVSRVKYTQSSGSEDEADEEDDDDDDDDF